MTDAEKEKVESNLLQAMNAIDNAIHNITDKDGYHYDILNLYVAKKEIKEILNAHFDYCARNRKEVKHEN